MLEMPKFHGSDLHEEVRGFYCFYQLFFPEIKGDRLENCLSMQAFIKKCYSYLIFNNIQMKKKNLSTILKNNT